MKKVLYVATVQSHIAQFHNTVINTLHRRGFVVHVAAKDNLKEKDTLKISDAVEKVYDVPFARSPLSFANLKAYKKLKQILKEEQYDVVYCHTPVGGVLSRLAGKKYRKKGMKIIYTSHGFHFYKGAPIKNWIVYYTIEKLMAKRTDAIITINQEDYTIAKKKLDIKKIYHIDGMGVDFNRLVCNRKKEEIRGEWGVSESDFILLSVGELNYNKNNIAVLKAMKQLNNPNIKYLIAGNGPLRESLELKAKEYGLQQQVKFLGYTRDLAEYLHGADAFCFMSYREGLGLAAIEAMHCGLPIITSNKHGINDYSVDGETGYKCEPNDYISLADAINRLCQSKSLCEMIGEHNKTVSLKYETNLVSEKICDIIGEELSQC